MYLVFLSFPFGSSTKKIIITREAPYKICIFKGPDPQKLWISGLSMANFFLNFHKRRMTELMKFDIVPESWQLIITRNLALLVQKINPKNS